MCNLQGIARVTPTESYNLQDIRHRDGRMMCNSQGIASATPTESYNLQGIRHRDGRNFILQVLYKSY